MKCSIADGICHAQEKGVRGVLGEGPHCIRGIRESD